MSKWRQFSPKATILKVLLISYMLAMVWVRLDQVSEFLSFWKWFQNGANFRQKLRFWRSFLSWDIWQADGAVWQLQGIFNRLFIYLIWLFGREYIWNYREDVRTIKWSTETLNVETLDQKISDIVGVIRRYKDSTPCKCKGIRILHLVNVEV
jgi:hypothetical protein